MKRLHPVAALLLAGLVSLGGCERNEAGGAGVAPLDIVPGTSCALDGMLLADYPGPKAQIHYAGRAEPDWFCDTVEMFNVYLSPEQVRVITAVYVQDMAAAAWDKPAGNWVDARAAWYVVGSRRHGSMGPTFASFAQRTDAEKFAAGHGGTVHAFAEVTPDMAVLDGGALHDSVM